MATEHDDNDEEPELELTKLALGTGNPGRGDAPVNIKSFPINPAISIIP